MSTDAAAPAARRARLDALRGALAECLLRDRNRLGKRVKRLARELRAGPDADGAGRFEARLARLEAACARSRRSADSVSCSLMVAFPKLKCG